MNEKYWFNINWWKKKEQLKQEKEEIVNNKTNEKH